jgi:hypothetical protein
VINNAIKAIELKIDAAIIGRAIHPDLPLVGTLGTKLSNADSKAITASCSSLSISPMAVLVTFCIVLLASFAALFNELPTSWAVLPIELPIPFGLMLMSRLCTCPDWISSEVGAK